MFTRVRGIPVESVIVPDITVLLTWAIDAIPGRKINNERNNLIRLNINCILKEYYLLVLSLFFFVFFLSDFLFLKSPFFMPSKNLAHANGLRRLFTGV